MGSKHGSLKERFFRHVSISDGCWSWSGNKRRGYGQINDNGTMRSAHRVSWEIHNGEIPLGMYVLHYCDNRECTNPKHLFVGTHSDNMKDASIKGRLFNPRKRLFDSDIRDIVNRRGCGEPLKSIAFDYSIHVSTVSKLYSRSKSSAKESKIKE